jgi:hypothetical protein
MLLSSRITLLHEMRCKRRHILVMFQHIGPPSTMCCRFGLGGRTIWSLCELWDLISTQSNCVWRVCELDQQRTEFNTIFRFCISALFVVHILLLAKRVPKSNHKLKRSYLGSCILLFSLAEAPQLPPPLRIWAPIRGRYWSGKERRHLFVTPGENGVRSPKFVWAPVYSCTHWLKLLNSPHPAFGLIYEGAIGQER